MRVLYLSQYFPPEIGGTSDRAFEMARAWVAEGHAVTVICQIPHYPSGVLRAGYPRKAWVREQLEGIDVLRVRAVSTPGGVGWRRMANYLSFMASAGLAGAVERGRFDLVYATSPPLPVGPAGLTVAALRRLPLVFEVRDLWPQVAADLGASGNSALLHVADRAARRCYRSAVRVVAVSEGYRPALFQAGVPEARLLVAPDGSNPDLFRFDESDRRSVRSRLGIPEERFVGLFAGLHGLAYDLDTLLHAASLLSDQDFLFLCVGSGPAKAAARRRALRDGIRNVTFLPEQPRDEIPALLSAADAAVVPRRSFPSNDAAVPVRIFDALACSRPVLLGGRGEAARVLDESGGGITVRPGDPGALVQALRSMRDDPRGRRAMGRSGRQFIEDHGDRRRLARALIGELQRTFGSGRGETSGP